MTIAFTQKDLDGITSAVDQLKDAFSSIATTCFPESAQNVIQTEIAKAILSTMFASFRILLDGDNAEITCGGVTIRRCDGKHYISATFTGCYQFPEREVTVFYDREFMPNDPAATSEPTMYGDVATAIVCYVQLEQAWRRFFTNYLLTTPTTGA